MTNEPQIRPDLSEAEQLAEEEKATLRYMRRSLVILGIAVVVIFGLAWLAKELLGSELEAATSWLTNAVGYPGVFLGVWVVDTFTLPISPDLILAVIANPGSSLNTWLALTVMCIASISGGHVAYFLARRVGRVAWVQRHLHRSLPQGRALFKRFGFWAVAIAGLTPVPFSIVCWFAGLYEMRLGSFSAATLARIPRFIGWYYLILLGYSL